MNPVQVNRRRFERFAVAPMYTRVAVRPLHQESFTLQGHAHDVSEGGIRFELDQPLEPGTPVAIQITLPDPASDPGPGRAVFALGNVVWIDDDPDEPGPTRMAAVFTRFARAGDRQRLLGQLASGRYRRAA